MPEYFESDGPGGTTVAISMPQARCLNTACWLAGLVPTPTALIASLVPIGMPLARAWLATVASHSDCMLRGWPVRLGTAARGRLLLGQVAHIACCRFALPMCPTATLRIESPLLCRQTCSESPARPMRTSGKPRRWQRKRWLRSCGSGLVWHQHRWQASQGSCSVTWLSPGLCC